MVSDPRLDRLADLVDILARRATAYSEGLPAGRGGKLRADRADSIRIWKVEAERLIADIRSTTEEVEELSA